MPVFLHFYILYLNRKRLLQSNPSLFEVAIPHTSRPRRKDEIDGKDYHFLPRHIFEADIKQGRFIEYGEYEKHLYGTSYEAIKKVMENSKICILNLYPQVNYEEKFILVFLFIKFSFK